MGKYKIESPNKEYTGSIAGVSFVDGKGETDNDWAADWFSENKYKVEEIKAEKDNSDDGDHQEKEISELTVNELKKMAKEKGIKGYSNMSEEDLINELKGQ